MDSIVKIALIGGSGVYSIFKNKESEVLVIKTPFGEVNLTKFRLNEKIIYFLPRHGSNHSIAPHMINYKANIYALFLEGVDFILATNAVGSLRQEIKPGDFVIIDQFIDLVSGPHTFYDGSFEIKIENQIFEGVKHTDVTQPYSSKIRESIIKSFDQFPEEKFHKRGCYVMFNGPRFETAAEISMFKQFGDVVGMTGAPEVILARELNLEYASINLVTNYGAGIQQTINHDDIIKLFDKKIEIFKEILIRTVSSL